jgi:hypothetical protein
MSDIIRVPAEIDPHSPADMAKLCREALVDWREAKGGSAAERKACRLLAWSVGRLIDLGAFPGELAAGELPL